MAQILQNPVQEFWTYKNEAVFAARLLRRLRVVVHNVPVAPPEARIGERQKQKDQDGPDMAISGRHRRYWCCHRLPLPSLALELVLLALLHSLAYFADSGHSCFFLRKRLRKLVLSSPSLSSPAIAADCQDLHHRRFCIYGFVDLKGRIHHICIGTCYLWISMICGRWYCFLLLGVMWGEYARHWCIMYSAFYNLVICILNSWLWVEAVWYTRVIE